ncbi:MULTISPECIES: threonine/serine exporter ThrE family protein [Peptoniphilus]|uniref:threonine/serine ThrE exporter family protein n=1 Tax=Peptoniphilus TaxID=162289 RepID=UPI0001DA9B44|nr:MULTISPECIES: threonine/serine exporter family protein [Peptoniphilus]EFI42317.1 hypothetical protein HMPREF0629_00962 [Peptoniphilus sp. oral taxon 386 str. F0131]
MERVLKDLNDAKRLLNLAIYSGQLLIMYGAEIYRAEDTVQRICDSMENVSSADAYVLPSGIFVSIEFEGEIVTIFKKVHSSATNLNKIDKINSFSRKFVKENISYEKGMNILKNIENESPMKEWKKNLSAAWAAAFFSLLFGGNIKDFFSTFIITGIMSFTFNKLCFFNFSFVINNFIGAFVASILAVFATNFGFSDNSDMIIISAIMILVPGVSATNAVRDIMNGDFLSGLMGLTKAIFLALSIALGVGVVLKFFR